MNLDLPRHTLFLAVTTMLLCVVPTMPTKAASRQLGLPPPLFGMNLYITGRERSDEEALALVRLAQQAGIAWSREELSWASWGDDSTNSFYDRRLKMLSGAGIGIIGMLLTTPERYRDRSCVDYANTTGQPAYWCPPNDINAYARWVRGVVERYDGDGIGDAPGSPRVAAWEIWNEPDQDGTWLPKANPAAYAALLRAGYAAVKASDHSGLVLNGGVMTFDAIGVGGFMDQVVAITGWDSFDVLSLHPWLIDYAPDAPELINRREGFDVTIPGRLALAQRWVASHGGGKQIWISEVGWSTCGGRCAPQFAKSEAQQADYMVRTFVLAAAAGVQHVSYFQMEDKFGGKQVPWSQAAVLRDDLSPKPAYTAYNVMTAQLRFARYLGTGAANRQGVLAHHRFGTPDGGSVDVLWRISGSQTIDLQLTAGRVATLVERDGMSQPLPAGATARLSVGEHPIYVRQVVGAERNFVETGQALRGRFLSFWEHNGGLPIFGMPIGPEQALIDEQGRLYQIQYLERARFEYHPDLAPPNDLLLGRLGVELLERKGVDWRTLPAVAGAAPGCRYFVETQHSLCPPFRSYWEHHGGLAIFGLPISEMQQEAATAGSSYMVQYFERNRFEYHPEQRPPNAVLLGRLGAELMPR